MRRMVEIAGGATVFLVRDRAGVLEGAREGGRRELAKSAGHLGDRPDLARVSEGDHEVGVHLELAQRTAQLGKWPRGRQGGGHPDQFVQAGGRLGGEAGAQTLRPSSREMAKVG